MIIDALENIFFYEKLLPHLADGMAVVKQLGAAPEVGRHEFEGGYLIVQKGETKPMDEGTFEVHRKYIDVQILLDGSEEVAWKPLSGLKVAIPYDETKDAERLDGTKENSMLISAGMFYAAYPEDGHKPVSHTTEKHTYTKIVMKLPVE
jgi:YhcH/YjgK/YiaL family protein